MRLSFCTSLSLSMIDLLGLQKQLTAPMRVGVQMASIRAGRYILTILERKMTSRYFYVEEAIMMTMDKMAKLLQLLFMKARDVINWFREYKRRRAFDSVRDICDLI